MFHPSEFELGETTGRILRRVEQERPARVVIDSCPRCGLLAQNPLRYRRQVLALKQFFTAGRCTVLLLDDKTPSRATCSCTASPTASIEPGAAARPSTARAAAILHIVKVRGQSSAAATTTTSSRRAASRSSRASSPPSTTAGSRAVPVGTRHRRTGRPAGRWASVRDQYAAARTDRHGQDDHRHPLRPARRWSAASGLPSSCSTRDSATLLRAHQGPRHGPAAARGRGAVSQVRQIDPAELSPGEFVHHVRRAVEIDGVRAS